MKEPVRLLVLEDNAGDLELLRATLERAGLPCNLTHVSNEAGFRTAVDGTSHFDLIISDYSLPAFDGRRALAMARERRPDVPFIFVSGTIGEEGAIESLVGGATDYVLKHRFGRLVPAVQRALNETSERNARRQAEQKLEATLEQLKSLFDNLDEVFFSIDPRADSLLQISPACEKLYGLPQRAFFANPNFWRTFAASADLAVVESAQSKLDSGEAVSFEYRIAKPDGSIRWVVAKMKPVCDAQGRTIRIDGSISDISDVKELEAQFLRAQRMENLGTLAGGIAHDLNNVLAPIMMGIDLLRERNSDSESQATLATLELCAKRGANLVKQILMFARGVEERRVMLHPGRVIFDMHSLLLRTFPKSIEIVLDVASDLWSVSADKTQFEQVLMNLCVNGRDAMPNGGTLTLAARNRLADSEPGSSEKEAEVLIAVSDTGHGIPSENLDKIFDPFFSTKAAGKGTGLGLSTVSAIVKSHGGSVTVASALGRGTTFQVSLPALVADVQREEDVKRNAVPSGNGELVLVVDDEAAIRDLARTILDSYGYRVMVAVDGVDGLFVYSQFKDRIDVIVTDLDMPTMNGSQMIQALERLNPEVRIISTGGIIEGDKPGMKVSGCVRAVLEKPFSPAHLLKTLRNVLQ